MCVDRERGLLNRSSSYYTRWEITCDWCGTLYNKDHELVGNGKIHTEGEMVQFDEFGSKTVCACCFEEVENVIKSCIDDIINYLEFDLNNYHEKIQNLLNRVSIISQIQKQN